MSASVLFAPLRLVANRLGALLSPARRARPGAAAGRQPASGAATSMRVNPFFDLFLDSPAADESAR